MPPPKNIAAFFDNDDDDDDDEPFVPQKQLDSQKLNNYATGVVRKSRKDKEKEAADAKKREEEERAAHAYAEFLDEFETAESSSNRRSTANRFVRSGQESAPAPPSASRPDSTGEPGHTRFQDEMANMAAASSASSSKPKGKRAMDAFLEELKRDQADREAKFSRQGQGRSVTAMAAYEGLSGSRDRGDSETSNVFVANLPAHVTEQSLGQFFARAGPVGSVKIMWPRGDATVGPGADMTASRRSMNSGLSGFVSFMKRKGAEAALRDFDGFDWGGSILRVGWSKAVPVAHKPQYTLGAGGHGSRRRGGHDGSRSRSHGHSRSRSREPHHQPRPGRRSRSRSSRSRSRSQSPHRTRGRSRRSESPSGRYHHSLEEKEELVTDTFIRAVASEVRGHGTDYAVFLKDREHENSRYGFLTDKHHRRHAFYRGLVESDRVLGPEFTDDGYNSVYSTDSGEESERERTRKTALGKLARKRFEAMLRALSGKRGELARCMAFSLEHAEAAAEIADIILASLLVSDTPVPRKVARLHLICDILHNSASAVPSAWKFRQEFEGRLGIVFDHLSNVYHSFPGRITAETFKKQFTAVLDLWEDWLVFPPGFLNQLRERLDGAALTKGAKEGEHGENARQEGSGTPEDAGGAVSSKFKSSSFQPAMAVAATATGAVVAGASVVGTGDVDGEPVGDDVDGEPLDDDMDGVPMDDDVDGAPMDDDVDGVLMEDVDGEPMDDDVDGMPMEDEEVVFTGHGRHPEQPAQEESIF
ncbi:hypothetical protein BDV98DRAFT_528109 [Pterulicium gracile]|uniref:CID domain-containing protein n=1 Tax=Pterulicium gracile TaxID=1884261 RepID=A0A5C3QLP1_9AGAR|nr:hypothetical protein BDV98DRAFT_528109 [Pterula gracilis]